MDFTCLFESSDPAAALPSSIVPIPATAAAAVGGHADEENEKDLLEVVFPGPTRVIIRQWDFSPTNGQFSTLPLYP